MDVHADAFGPQGAEHRRPIDRQAPPVPAGPRRDDRRGTHRRGRPAAARRGMSAECLVVLPGDRLPPGHGRRQLGQLRDAQGALDVGKPVVEAQIDHLVGKGALCGPLAEIGGDAVIAEQPHAPGKLGVVGGDRAAFAGRHVLDRMEAEGVQQRPASRPAGRDSCRRWHGRRRPPGPGRASSATASNAS